MKFRIELVITDDAGQEQQRIVALLNKAKSRQQAAPGLLFLDFYGDWHTQISHSV